MHVVPDMKYPSLQAEHSVLDVHLEHPLAQAVKDMHVDIMQMLLLEGERVPVSQRLWMRVV